MENEKEVIKGCICILIALGLLFLLIQTIGFVYDTPIREKCIKRGFETGSHTIPTLEPVCIKETCKEIDGIKTCEKEIIKVKEFL